MRITGSRVLVTGASSGIGRAMSVRLAREGALLAIAARRTELLDSLADEIVAAGGATPWVCAVDLAVPGAAADLGAGVLDRFGGLDIVVNNAGSNLTAAQSAHGDAAAARAVFETNVWSPLALTAAVVPAMRRQGSGMIVNVTSTVQAVPIPLLGYYSASKAALAQATRSLRSELASTPLKVLEVVPGATDTALRDIDELPWRGSPPPTFPPVTPDSTAAAIVRGIARDAERVVHPTYSLVPLELPVVGRVIARLASRRIDSAGAIAGPS